MHGKLIKWVVGRNRKVCYYLNCDRAAGVMHFMTHDLCMRGSRIRTGADNPVQGFHIRQNLYQELFHLRTLGWG